MAAHNLLRLFNFGGGRFERLVAARQYGLGPRWAALLTWSMVPMLALACLGLATKSARRAPCWLWAVPVLLLSTVFVLAANRHRAGIDPFLAILAALAIEAAASRWRRSRATTPLAPRTATVTPGP